METQYCGNRLSLKTRLTALDTSTLYYPRIHPALNDDVISYPSHDAERLEPSGSTARWGHRPPGIRPSEVEQAGDVAVLGNTVAGVEYRWALPLAAADVQVPGADKARYVQVLQR